MGSSDDRVEWFPRPLVPILDEEVAWNNCGCPSAAPYFEVVQFRDGHGMWWPPPPFFLRLWHIRFPLPQLLPSGGMACVVATCHSRISWGVLGSGDTFQFSHLFLRRFLFKPLVLFFCAYFCKILVFLCSLLWSFSLLWVLPLWFLRSSPPFLSFTSFFRYALLLFLFFASFFSALFPFLTLLFLFPFWWNLLILGTLPPQLPSFSLVWVRL